MKDPDAPFNGHTALLMRVAAVAVPASLLLSAGSAFGGWLNSQDVREQNDQIEADRLEAREARCAKDDEDNAKVRRAIVDGGLTTGTTSGEAIITISQQTGRAPDPAVVDAYRKVQVKLLQPALEGIANTFPSYRWDPKKQVCIEVPMDDGG